MKNKKLTKIISLIGVCVLIAGAIAGVVFGLIFSNESGFNLLVAIIIWVLCIVTASGFITVSESLEGVQKSQKNDEQIIQEIIKNVKNKE